MNLKFGMTIIGAVLSFAVCGQAVADGNRYMMNRFYLSEISVSEAYLEMERGEEHEEEHGQEAVPVLIDVRTLREYAAGHPEDAYNVPFPNIYGGNDQDPAVLYWEVYKIVNGNLDTPIMTLCRTGFRSVLAGNILANPDSNAATAGLPPFTHVRNIWEGFVGQNRFAFTGSTVALDGNGAPYVLDLNNDGVINTDAADVYTQVKDANPDKDGWRNFAALPWTVKIKPRLSFLQDTGLYSALNLTPVK